jgi:dynein heavy chain
LERAAQLVEGFAGECEQWKQTVENLDTQYEYLLGDCILAAGFISYMGPFTSTYRDELVKSWKKCVML